jgi:hypothetical protein
VSTQRALRREIQEWVEGAAPPAPWFEHRVIAAVRAGVEPRHRGGVWLRARSLAAVVNGLLVVGVLVGLGLGAHYFPGSVTDLAPSRDPAIVSYRALVDVDIRAVDSSFQLSTACKTRDACARDLAQMRTDTETLLRDISTRSVPASVAARAERVEDVAQQFIAQLDLALVVIQQPNSDYIAASAAPMVHGLDLAVAKVDCWPATPVDGDHGITCS